MTLVAFETVPINEQREPMVSLADFPFICVPVYYKNGWTETADMFLREQLARKLQHIQERQLTPKGLRWIVFDAYRNRQVQGNIYQYYWDKFSIENREWDIDRLRAHTGTYVSVPNRLERIPPHASGGSVDLGLYDSNKNIIVSMGPDFDEFSPAVRTDYYEEPGRDITIRDTRRLMNEILAEQDISSDHDEYFHKDFGNQLWAARSGKPTACYGEVISCRLEAGRVVTVYGIDVEKQGQLDGIRAIENGLLLTHPSNRKIAPLPVPSQLVLQTMRARV